MLAVGEARAWLGMTKPASERPKLTPLAKVALDQATASSSTFPCIQASLWEARRQVRTSKLKVAQLQLVQAVQRLPQFHASDTSVDRCLMMHKVCELSKKHGIPLSRRFTSVDSCRALREEVHRIIVAVDGKERAALQRRQKDDNKHATTATEVVQMATPPQSSKQHT